LSMRSGCFCIPCSISRGEGMGDVQRRLVGIWAALTTLLALTVAGSFVFTGASSIVVSIGIAFAKAALILWFFMQISRERGLIRIFSVAGAIWLMILFTLVTIDYATR
jgi:cytochrome c oxidase subunit IV